MASEKTGPSPSSPEQGVSRRTFLTSAAITGAGFMIVPRRVLGQGMTAPSDVLNIATIGINGQGATNTQAVMSQNIVAICDCDFRLLDNKLKAWKETVYPPVPRRPAANTATPPTSAWKEFGPTKAQQEANAKWAQTPQADRLKRFVDEQMPKVARYRDYREMLDKQKDIDAVIIATPDHQHAMQASAAMDAGKHVYVQKPLCWSVHEARHLATKAAANPKLVTQMGNQGHSLDDARTGQEYLLAGAIGDVTDIHVWTNRPLGYWPQGVPRPTAAPPERLLGASWNNDGVNTRLAAAMAGDFPVPDTLSWDLFLSGAPEVPYHPIYHPFNWRGWVDWGQGALGDMGAHLIDHPVWALNLGLPSVVETVSTPFNGATYPMGTSTYYEFPRPGKPTVKLKWSDGGLLPPRPEELGEEKLRADGGIIYYGTKGKMLQQTYGARPRLLPAERHNSYGPPKLKLARVPHESHEMNWVNAIKGQDTISCPFSYAAHLVEIMLLGVVSLRAGTKLQYDGASMRVTNNAAANAFLTRTYRQGWAL